MSDLIPPKDISTPSIRSFLNEITQNKDPIENNKFNLMLSAQVKTLKEAEKAATSLEDLDRIWDKLKAWSRIYVIHTYEQTLSFKSQQGKRTDKELQLSTSRSLSKKAATRAKNHRGYFKTIKSWEELDRRMDKIEEAGHICSPLLMSKFKNGRFQNNTKDNNEWYTPRFILQRARATMGGIDLDPASCPIAQKNVQAKRFFTKEDDGLTKPWRGKVWLNPPYCDGNMTLFVEKLLKELPHIDQAMLLSHNHLDTRWAQALLEKAEVSINLSGRTRFLNLEGKMEKGTSQYGQTLFGFGVCPIKFTACFSGAGHIHYSLSAALEIFKFMNRGREAIKEMDKNPNFRLKPPLSGANSIKNV